jgi:hypothetical protein
MLTGQAKKDYQRQYMRRWRAKQAAAKPKPPKPVRAPVRLDGSRGHRSRPLAAPARQEAKGRCIMTEAETVARDILLKAAPHLSLEQIRDIAANFVIALAVPPQTPMQEPVCPQCGSAFTRTQRRKRYCGALCAYEAAKAKRAARLARRCAISE